MYPLPGGCSTVLSLRVILVRLIHQFFWLQGRILLFFPKVIRVQVGNASFNQIWQIQVWRSACCTMLHSPDRWMDAWPASGYALPWLQRTSEFWVVFRMIKHDCLLDGHCLSWPCARTYPDLGCQSSWPCHCRRKMKKGEVPSGMF